MIIDIRVDLVRKRLRECQEDYAFWCRHREQRQRQGRPSELTFTLGALQREIDDLQAQLKALEVGQ